MENTPLKPIEGFEQTQARRRIAAWISYFRREIPTNQSSNSVRDIYLMVRYIIWLEDRGQPDHWELRELIVGSIMGFCLGAVLFYG